MAEHFYKVFDSVLADNRLTYPEIILFGVIVRLSMNSEKKCFASNQALSEIMRCSKSSISKWLETLTKCGYITRSVHYAEGTKYIDKRYISAAYPADLREDVPSDGKGVCRRSGIGYPVDLQGGIPPNYKGSNINIAKEVSNIIERDNGVRKRSPIKSNNFFLKLAVDGNADNPF